MCLWIVAVYVQHPKQLGISKTKRVNIDRLLSVQQTFDYLPFQKPVLFTCNVQMHKQLFFNMQLVLEQCGKKQVTLQSKTVSVELFQQRVHACLTGLEVGSHQVAL